mgnify:FL=1
MIHVQNTHYAHGLDRLFAQDIMGSSLFSQEHFVIVRRLKQLTQSNEIRQGLRK